MCKSSRSHGTGLIVTCWEDNSSTIGHGQLIPRFLNKPKENRLCMNHSAYISRTAQGSVCERCGGVLHPGRPRRSAALWGRLPAPLSRGTNTNTDGLLLCHPDLKALLQHVYWQSCHCWQEDGHLEAAGGFPASNVTLARWQPTDAYAS